jgi:AcrR family transcriptional regulator
MISLDERNRLTIINVVRLEIGDMRVIAGKVEMGSVERREREREEVRKKILDAARELFASEGYDHVTMRRIAEAIEYSPTTIYNHFEDKDDLVQSLCEEDFARLLSFLKRQPPAASAVDFIRQLGLAYARFALEYPNHYRFMFMTPNRFEKPKGAGTPGEQAFGLARMAAEKGLASGQFTGASVDTMAQVFWASLHGAVALLITHRPEQWPSVPPAPDLVEQVVENTIRGFLKKEP